MRKLLSIAEHTAWVVRLAGDIPLYAVARQLHRAGMSVPDTSCWMEVTPKHAAVYVARKEGKYRFFAGETWLRDEYREED